MLEYKTLRKYYEDIIHLKIALQMSKCDKKDICKALAPIKKKIRTMYKLNNIHNSIPQTVGNKIDIIIHFQELVSFFIVKQVVEHGQCITEKIITDIAVAQVHPLSINKSFKTFKLLISVKLPVAV